LAVGAAATVLAMVVVTSSPASTANAQELSTKWTIGVSLVVFGIVCASIGGLQMTAGLDETQQQNSWLLGLTPVFGVFLFVFWVVTTTNPPEGWLPSDPRRQPSHMLAAILFSAFFAALFTVTGPMTLLGQIIRGNRGQGSTAGESADQPSAG
jgi:uncharacterized membrane protein YfcA